jgi:DNA processing protein
MNFDNEKLCQVALSLTNGIGSVLIHNLVSYCGSAEEVFRVGAKRLEKIPNIGEILAKNLASKQSFFEAEKELMLAEKEKVSLLFYTEKDYPDRLKRLYDAPALLYYKGNADLQALRVVSMVGTRQATDYGKNIAEAIVEALVPYQVLVVSGLAYGIDIAAHRASLHYRLPTLGVMACGIDVIYPYVHKKTAEQMLEKGGIITENRIGQKPDSMRFPARNRIIAGMSDAVVVVETATKGGTLITAEYANNYHKEVFAVPGNLTQPLSEGCNRLIRQNKANIYTSVQDIVESLNWDLENQQSKKPKAKQITFDLSRFTQDESVIMSLLCKQKEMHIDEISWHSQIHLNKLASVLLNLEFQGVIKSIPGKRYAAVFIE